ncbi:hypothetical protein Cadr_000010046 [Camelus dromedarius]|uniref:Uncharacterized protein n=1 Tax=Camelus dromedarius TaxID=9838 RepID=A0A5N4DWE1_CAMDR|nr:hypothetical protein Cadr_000010046 [Camelus dromedarius]
MCKPTSQLLWISFVVLHPWCLHNSPHPSSGPPSHLAEDEETQGRTAGDLPGQGICLDCCLLKTRPTSKVCQVSC